MTTQPLHVHLLPTLIEPGALSGGTAVIIDILRASSTIITALHNGAERVVPCGTPEEAMRVRSEAAPGTVLLGGERGGVRIAGFDLGNSPSDYGPETVAGRTVAFTTTNGTKALLAAASARTILIGAFLNRRAVVERLEREHRPTHLICAGTDGVITGEDVLFAGAVVRELLQTADRMSDSQPHWSLDDSAVLALNHWTMATKDSGMSPVLQLEVILRNTQGGRNLTDLGYDSDIELCSRLDCIATVPVFDRSGRFLRCR